MSREQTERLCEWLIQECTQFKNFTAEDLSSVLFHAPGILRLSASGNKILSKIFENKNHQVNRPITSNDLFLISKHYAGVFYYDQFRNSIVLYNIKESFMLTISDFDVWLSNIKII